MKRVHRKRKVSKFTRQGDFISSMPDDLITNILHCLPIQDAVRTCILSRNWRFKWTLLTQLVFDREFFRYIQTKEEGEKNYGKIINGILLHIKGAITKFLLWIKDPICSEINNWVMLLSGKGIKNLMLINKNETPIKLNTHLFSCIELEELELMNCCLPPMPCFRGFPNLLSFYLHTGIFETCNIWEFLTRCPLLETMAVDVKTTCVMKRIETSRYENLKILSFPLCKLDNLGMITSSHIFKFTGFFPKLQDLYLSFSNCKLSADTRKSIPTALTCLKTLRLIDLDFINDNMVSCAIELISGFPNLESLMIFAFYKIPVSPPAVYSSEVEYINRMGQLKLRKMELNFTRGLDNELAASQATKALAVQLENKASAQKYKKNSLKAYIICRIGRSF